MTGLPGIHELAVPAEGKESRPLKSHARVVLTGNQHRGHLNAALRHGRERKNRRRRALAFHIGGRHKKRAFYLLPHALARETRPMRKSHAAKAVGHDDHTAGTGRYGFIQLVYPFAAAGRGPVCLLNPAPSRMVRAPDRLSMARPGAIPSRHKYRDRPAIFCTVARNH